MSIAVQTEKKEKLFLSGNEAVARAAWEAGVRVVAAYPGTPSTEILEYLSIYKDIYSEWSVNEKVSMEVAIGASLAGSRSMCAMKHVGMNVASDAFMTQSLAGVVGGLVIVVADDVGLSSSQNEQDSRYWGRFGHMPILEPADSLEAYQMVKVAFDLSEQFDTPVIVRLTTRVCHVKTLLQVGEREEHPAAGFVKDPQRWVMVPGNAKNRLPLMHERDKKLRVEAEKHEFNVVYDGKDTRIGFVTSGPAFMHVRESYPDMPVLKLGFSCPAPIEKIRAFASGVEKLVVVEETEPLLEQEIRAAGIQVYGKDILPSMGELAPNVLNPAIKGLLGEPQDAQALLDASQVFPRPPTMCVACPHLGPYYSLSRIRNLNIIGDIGCYTLGAGHPWNALDTCISMGASMGMALGMDKGRGESDEKKHILAVIGDSTFLHMGMQGLLDICYNRGNVTIMLLDNRTVGMTGGQENPATGFNLHGEEAPRVNLRKICEALGVKSERINEVDPYELPTLFKMVRTEIKIEEPSVIITNRPCVLTDRYDIQRPFKVIEDKCTGCGNCVDLGCPSILVDRRETVIKPNGKERELSFVHIETSACTGCELCVETCGPDAIVHAERSQHIRI